MRVMIFLSTFLFLIGLGTSVYAACSGYVRLTIEPAFAPPFSFAEPSVYGLSDCDGKTAYFKQESCSGGSVSSCTVNGIGCKGNGFLSPSVSGTYEYYACIDKNNLNGFNDAGEQSSLFYIVGYDSLPEFDWTGIVQIIILSTIVLLIKRNAPSGI